MLRFVRWIKCHSVGLAITLILLGIVFHTMTLPYSPNHWIDEVQINEIARGGIVNKSGDQNMCIVRSDGAVDTQSWALYYLGGLCSEIGYQCFGATGPRIMALLFLLLATPVVGYYIYRKTGNRTVAALAALLFFAFPTFGQSVRGGRFDILAVGFIFCALGVVQSRKDETGLPIWRIMMAGAFSALACFSWVTATLCLPIVLWELWDNLPNAKAVWHNGPRLAILWGIGAFTVALLLVTPFLASWQETCETFRAIVLLNTNASTAKINIGVMITTLFSAPYVYLLGVIALCSNMRRFWPLLLAVIAFLIVCSPRMYVFRSLYLLPYTLIPGCLVLAKMERPWLRFGSWGIALLLALYTYGTTVLARNGLEIFAKDYRDTTAMERLCEAEIGREVSIYYDGYQLYYVGRTLNWKQWQAINRKARPHILSKADFFLSDEAPNAETKELLNKQGFTFEKILRLPTPSHGNIAIRLLQKTGRLRPIGPFYLYRKIQTSHQYKPFNGELCYQNLDPLEIL